MKRITKRIKRLRDLSSYGNRWVKHIKNDQQRKKHLKNNPKKAVFNFQLIVCLQLRKLV